MTTKPKIEQKVDTVVKPVVKELSALESFTVNHPLTVKIVGITAITAVTLGVIAGWKAKKLVSNKTEVLDVNVVSFEEPSRTV